MIKHFAVAMKSTLILLILLGCLHAASAQTAEDALRFTDRSPATGARMIGLAGASLSGVADYTALTTNPAGLAFFQNSSFSGSFNTSLIGNESYSGTAGFTGNRITEQVTAFNTGNLGYVYRAPTVQGSFVFALGFNHVNTFEQELRFGGVNTISTISSSFLPYPNEYSLDGLNLDSLEDIPFAAFNSGVIEFYPELLEANADAYPFLQAAIPGTSIRQAGQIREEGNMYEASLGGALQVAPDVTLGVSINIPFGEYDYNSTFEETDINNENIADDYSVLQEDGTFLEGFDFLSYRQSVESNIVGINVRLGGSINLASNLRAGFAIETPTRYFVDETYSSRFLTEFDDGGVLTYGEQSDDIGNGTFDYEIQSPWKLGAGIQYNLGVLTLLADLELVTWNQLRFEANTDQAYFDDINDTIKEEYAATFNERIGLELYLEEVTLRAGFAFKPDPRKTELRGSDGTTANRDRYYYSAGIGYNFSKHFRMDAGWIRTQFDSAYLAYPEDALGPRQDAALLIDESITRDQIVLGVTYNF